MIAAPLASGQAADKPAAAPKAQAPAIVKEAGDPINVAVIGVGAMGQLLLNACLYKDAPLPNLRFKAVCDIWPYTRKLVAWRLRGHKHMVNQYEDYRELLATEKDLHAVLIATPDWMHAEQANACLAAGLHVYCEEEMSNTLEGARSMVLAARKSGKLLQIGRQRRSNPRYRYALDKIVNGNQILGRVGQVNAQWNRSKMTSLDITCASKIVMPPELLAKYGYASMHELMNWRWFRKYGTGMVGTVGGNQLDVINWFLGAPPQALTAMGSHEPGCNHDWCDHVMCLLEYKTDTGPVNACYQVLSSSGLGGQHETFMGKEGSLVMSEKESKTLLLREPMGSDWSHWQKEKVIEPRPERGRRISGMFESSYLEGHEPQEAWGLPDELDHSIFPSQQPFRPHLVNFFDAIRRGAPLACPAEQAYATAVVTLAINRAVEAREKIVFKREDFVV